MADIGYIAEKTFEYLKTKEGVKADFTVSATETDEITMKDGKFTLLRTLFDENVSIKVIKDYKRGLALINKCTEEAVKKAVDDALLSAEAGDPDECFDIAPGMEPGKFRMGVLEPDIDRLIERTDELARTVAKKHKKIKLIEICAKYVKSSSIYRTTEGTKDECVGGCYVIVLEFAGSDGEETTGLCASSAVFDSLNEPLIRLASIEQDLQDAENSLNPIRCTEKFEGDVIFTPQCTEDMLSYLLGNAVTDQPVLSGTSVWLKRVGEQVVSPLLTVSSKPWDRRIIVHEVHTSDGFRSEDYTLIEKGVLNCFATSLYVSNKCKVNRAANSSHAFVVEPGDTAYADMISSVKKGLIVGAISCGSPGPNGEISGVAKNSFFVEDGKIKGAVIETMISTNLFDMFRNIKAVSKERLCNGAMVMPGILCSGITVSGKAE